MPSSKFSPMDHDAAHTFQDMLYHHARAMSYVSVYYGVENREIKQLLTQLLHVARAGRKLVFLGTGKSFKIVHKTVAMLTSLGIDARALHPSEALHGDMGTVRPGDALLVCSSSGETQELALFLKHAQVVLQPAVKVLVTSSTQSALHALVDCVLYVPQPAEFKEKTIQHGLPSPTISTTLMLSVLDCFCLALTELYFDGNSDKRLAFFKAMHPGGGIGKQLAVKPVSSDVPVPVPVPDPVATTSMDDAGHISLDVTEVEFLQFIVEFDYCVVDGIRYSSHLLQHQYREWKRHTRTFKPKTLMNGESWNLAAVLAPQATVHA
ncbi:LANO_0D02124g1_1 [Lachancea nothofagi CBS 11611]|uniref:LANO_0D02124g1_1 n=1 Tax=Lachancea nothofagi CBS 11611 TaxID=1266666 RepID=A0A1G4JE16_9SACH|nr:LANO_0D02124g1_1 [Lachancea nothofagi CBS 11611]